MKLLILLPLFMFLYLGAMAQHEHHPGMSHEKPQDTVPSGAGHHDHSEADMMMNHSFSLNLPMTMNGSGTGWLPENSPMYGTMVHAGKWMLMMHGSLFLRYNKQDLFAKGSRGGDKFDAPNWFMMMGQRKSGAKGLFHFSGMFSLDPVTAGGAGYPLLFQTGESYKGRALFDRQHPHDLVSELSIGYTYALSQTVDIFGYLGYPGEPALGPVTFMHRPSSLDNPNAPISHHWVDATHITFGVATAGIRAGKVKLEASSFTGREPDEHRYDFDKARFDSWSARISFAPSRNWALQASHGYVKSPEALHPDENVNKTTASAIFNTSIQQGKYFSAAAIWGLNKSKGHEGENAALLEGAWHLDKTALYFRYEFTEKSSEELVLEPSIFGDHGIFSIHTLTLGVNRELASFKRARLAAGVNYSFYKTEKALQPLYGSAPMSGQVYLRVYPGVM